MKPDFTVFGPQAEFLPQLLTGDSVESLRDPDKADGGPSVRLLGGMYSALP